MYDWPEQQVAINGFWLALLEALLRRGIRGPTVLARGGEDSETWENPELLLSQTCGFPLATTLKDKVKYVATPIYGVEGCEGHKYSSAVIVRKDSGLKFDGLWGKVFAYNSIDSLSGYRTARAMFGNMGCFFGKTTRTGGHRQSAQAVMAGEADVATLDAVSWHLLQQHEPETADQIMVLGWTKLRPALPFITSLATSDDDLAKLREALQTVVDDPNNRSLCETLGLSGFKILQQSDYDQLAKL